MTWHNRAEELERALRDLVSAIRAQEELVSVALAGENLTIERVKDTQIAVTVALEKAQTVLEKQ